MYINTHIPITTTTVKSTQSSMTGPFAWTGRRESEVFLRSRSQESDFIFSGVGSQGSIFFSGVGSWKKFYPTMTPLNKSITTISIFKLWCFLVQKKNTQNDTKILFLKWEIYIFGVAGTEIFLFLSSFLYFFAGKYTFLLQNTIFFVLANTQKIIFDFLVVGRSP